MSQSDIQEIIKRVSTDSETREQFLSALGALSKEDANFKKQLLSALDVGSNEGKEWQSLFSIF